MSRNSPRKATIHRVWSERFDYRPVTLDELRWFVFLEEEGRVLKSEELSIPRAYRSAFNRTVREHCSTLLTLNKIDPLDAPIGLISRFAVYRLPTWSRINAFFDAHYDAHVELRMIMTAIGETMPGLKVQMCEAIVRSTDRPAFEMISRGQTKSRLLAEIWSERRRNEKGVLGMFETRVRIPTSQPLTVIAEFRIDECELAELADAPWRVSMPFFPAIAVRPSITLAEFVRDPHNAEL